MRPAMSKQLREAVVEAIRALAEGRGATLDDVALQADLMGLECAIAAVGVDQDGTVGIDDVAAAVTLLLEEAANSLEEHPHSATEPNEAAAARAALGLEPGTQARPLRGRRGQPGRAGTIARWLSYEPASVFKPRQDGRSVFDALIHKMAGYVVRQEIAHQVNQRRTEQQARRPPLESAMRVDWLARFEDAYRIWNCVTGLQGDLRLALAALREAATDDVDHFARKSLYYYARLLAELERFVRERGGLWVFPDPAAEQTIADATWMLRRPTSVTEIDESLLRLAVAGWPETALFVQATHRDAALRRIVADWTNWVASCHCDDVEHPHNGCIVHECMRWAEAFITTLDAQWDLLADWYEIPRPRSSVS
jgi:hypothetical protein